VLLEPGPRIDEVLLRVLQGGEVLVFDRGQKGEEGLLLGVGRLIAQVRVEGRSLRLEIDRLADRRQVVGVATGLSSGLGGPAENSKLAEKLSLSNRA